MSSNLTPRYLASQTGFPQPVFPVSASPSFKLASTLKEASKREGPPITLEEDLGPEPVSNELWTELFGGELSDLSDQSDNESSDNSTGVSHPGRVRPRRARLILDCVEIPRKRQKRTSTSHARSPPESPSPSPSPPPPPLPSQSCTTVAECPAPRQSWKNSKRREKRKEVKLQLGAKRRFVTRPGALRSVLGSASPLSVGFLAEDMAAAKGAHTGKMGSKKGDGRQHFSLKQLLSEGFKHVQWDEPRVRLWTAKDASSLLCVAGQDVQEGQSAPFGAQQDRDHRRGGFPAFNVGCAMGMGSSEPVALNTGSMGTVLARLIGHEGVRRMASYHNAAFSLWAPRLYAKYEETIEAVYRRNPNLPRNFSDSVFSAATFNFGGQVWTYKHRDFFNWAFGWCFITALGRFDPSRSGQMILWELKLVVDFPHAATIAIPSAVITHGNTPVAGGDQRVSFTQYSAGPIFRWVENGFRTERQFEEEDPAAFSDMIARKPMAYKERLPLYSTLDELTQGL
ncbi:hypothetical protein VNI00_017510 [Paramarasmius palmivorus]|uniref:Uncharacterized protein n=1 Tax=Paramarasmius palmivorus TaxID=297713 RepID=A0AAW0AYY6_9AGAR